MKKIILATALLNFSAIIRPAAPEEMTQSMLNKNLMQAVRKGKKNTVKEFINYKADVNYIEIDNSGKTTTPLEVAARSGEAAIIECLVKANTNVNNTNQNRETPLYIAAQRGVNKYAIKYLIKLHADVNIPNLTGSTPLLAAAMAVEKDQTHYTAIVKCLLKANADANKANNNEIAPLLMAADKGHIYIVESLIKAQADVNKADKNEITPLLTAADQGHTYIAQSLIEAHADLNKTYQNGFLPLYAAAQSGHFNTVELLINAHKSHIIAPLCAAVKMVYANEHKRKWDALIQSSKQRQLSDVKKRACCMANTDEIYPTESLTSILEKLPLECLHIIIEHLPLASLATFRQLSKKCRVAAEHQYVQRLKNRIDADEEYFNMIRTRALKLTRQDKIDASTCSLERAACSDLWQYILDTQPYNQELERQVQLIEWATCYADPELFFSIFSTIITDNTKTENTTQAADTADAQQAESMLQAADTADAQQAQSMPQATHIVKSSDITETADTADHGLISDAIADTVAILQADATQATAENSAYIASQDSAPENSQKIIHYRCRCAVS